MIVPYIDVRGVDCVKLTQVIAYLRLAACGVAAAHKITCAHKACVVYAQHVNDLYVKSVRHGMQVCRGVAYVANKHFLAVGIDLQTALEYARKRTQKERGVLSDVWHVEYSVRIRID